MILDRNGFGLWSFIAKRAFKATFKRPKQSESREMIPNTLKEKEIAIYIHIPFCKSICLYCPYVRYPLRNRRSLDRYVEALKTEIDIYGQLLDDLDLHVIDIHAGGGTPSLLSGRQWGDVLDTLTENFDGKSKIAIEANPNDFSQEDRVFDSVDHGVNEVSLGVQSLQRSTLKKLGRIHGAEESLKSIENLREAGVEYINADMMYMVPGHPSQSIQEWREDLEKISDQDVDEITCYPTLITDYCLGYRLVEKGEVDQPSKSEFKEMMYLAEDVLSSKGFEPVEIYGYGRKEGWKYVTVNYEMEGPLLGLGCGAMGFTGGYEWINTCSVPEYIRTVQEGELPIAGSRTVDVRERAIRYTSCRLFVCRSLDLIKFRSKFGKDFGELVGRSGFGMMLKLLRLTSLIKKRGRNLQLTRKGLFVAHQQCWSFVLNIPCRMAEEFMKAPWPSEVSIP